MRGPLLWLAAAEASLAVVAVVAAALAGVPLAFGLDGKVLASSVAATALLAAVNLPLYRLAERTGRPRGPVRFFRDEVAPLVADADARALVALAAFAGLGEELLFRGVVQPLAGLAPASLLFGLLHGPTPALWPLAVWAAAVGAGLGLLYEATGSLVAPILAHALYDALALLDLRRRARRSAPARRVAPAPAPAIAWPRGDGRMRFAKAEALGNDFLLVEAPELPAAEVERAAVAKAACDRRRGVGADGLIVFWSEPGDPPFRMKLYNADGSPAEMSGNGLRCLAAYLVYTGRIVEDRFAVATDAGPKGLELLGADGTSFRFRSDLGRPRLSSRDVPFELDPPREPVVDEPLEVDGRRLLVTTLWMSNPQCIVFTDRLDRDELLRYGPRIERHPRFPQRTNVELVEVRSRNEIAIAIWERGAGETAASGTGSAASAVAAILAGKANERVTVHCPGGRLEVDWTGRDRVFVTGPARIVAEGVVLAAAGEEEGEKRCESKGLPSPPSS